MLFLSISKTTKNYNNQGHTHDHDRGISNNGPGWEQG